MHANGALLHKLFTALRAHDHETMASCYHPHARFRDIAFDLEGREQIGAMWRMICSGDIEVKFEVVGADDHTGQVKLVDTYTFDAKEHPPGRPVRNAIDSRFQFKEGLIWRQDDDCDAKLWARQAIGGIKGFLAGRIHFLRSRAAKAKLEKFVGESPA